MQKNKKSSLSKKRKVGTYKPITEALSSYKPISQNLREEDFVGKFADGLFDKMMESKVSPEPFKEFVRDKLVSLNRDIMNHLLSKIGSHSSQLLNYSEQEIDQTYMKLEKLSEGMK